MGMVVLGYGAFGDILIFRCLEYAAFVGNIRQTKIKFNI